MCALLGLDKLECRTNGVGGGVGRAAEQAVCDAHLNEHGAEVVALKESCAAILCAHLALAQCYHFLDHCVHALVGGGINDLKAVNIKAALFGSSLDLIDIADEDRGQETVLLQACRRLEDASVAALGVNYLAGIVLENFDKIFEHFIFLHKYGFNTAKNSAYYFITTANFFQVFHLISIYKPRFHMYNIQTVIILGEKCNV